MNKFLLLIVIVLSFINVYSYENIKWKKMDIPELAPNDPSRQYFTIAGTVFLDVFFLESNPNYGWVSGFNSLVLRTTDGGKTWDYSMTSRNGLYQLESVFFLNEKVGYASGPCNNRSDEMAGVFKSTDGGVTWKEITPLFRIDNGFYVINSLPSWGLYFVDENEGYLVGGECNTEFAGGPKGVFSQAFFKTTNGGQSWSLSTSNYKDTKLADLLVDENGTGWAISSGALWKSDAARKNWDIYKLTGDVDWHEDISKFNNSFIIPYSKGCDGNNNGAGGIKLSTDLGNSWVDYNTGHAMYGSLMVNDSVGWGVGYNASIYQTTSKGKDWKRINTCLEGGDFIDDIAVDANGNYWLVGDEIWRSYPAVFDTLQRQNQVLSVCYGERVNIDLDTNLSNIIWNTNVFSSSFSYEALDSRTFSAIYFNEECPDTVYKSTFAINVRPRPDIQLLISDSEPCAGDTVYVSVNPSFSSYSWTRVDDNSTLGFNGYNGSFTESGTYTIKIYDENFCENEVSFVLDFAPLPEIRIDSVGRTNFCYGDSLYLIASHNGVKINWFKEGEVESISSNDSLLVLESGNYFAIVSSAAGCTFQSEMFSAIARLDTNNFKFSLGFDGNWFDKDIVEKGQFVCANIKLRNYRDFDVLLTNPIVLGNTEFSIPQYQLPLNVPALSTADLEVCFLAKNEGVRVDTILIKDRCSDQYLPLLTIVKDKVFPANTGCNLDLSLVNVSLRDKYFILFGVPFPNPASNETNLELIEFIPNGYNRTISVNLYDILGNLISKLDFTEIEREKEKYGDLVKWNVRIDASAINSGRYIIKISSPKGEKGFSFIKI